MITSFRIIMAFIDRDNFALFQFGWKDTSLRRHIKYVVVSRKSRKLFGPEKPFVILLSIIISAYSVKLIFSYVVKGIKIKISAKFHASRRLSCEDTKKIMSPEMRPKSFGTSEKQAPDTIYLVQERMRIGHE